MSTDGDTLFEKFESAVKEVIAAYKVANVDGKMTFTEIISLVGKCLGKLVSLAEVFHGGVGSAKKAAVMAAIGAFYDQVIAPIDISKIPNFIEPIIDKGLKSVILIIADGITDAIVAIFNEGGWPDAPDTPDEPVTPPVDSV
jgi:hypothetical protein